MENTEFKIDNSRIFLLEYILFLSSFFIFDKSTINTFMGIEKNIIFTYFFSPLCFIGLLSLLFFGSKYTREEKITVGTLLALFGLSCVFSGSITFLTGVLFIVSTKSVNLKSLPKIVFYTQAAVIAVIALLALTGTIDNYGFHSYRIVNEDYGIYRQSLGFSHPNVLGAQLVQLSVCWLWLTWDKWKWYKYLIYIPIVAMVIFVCNSQTSVVVVLLLIIMAVAIRILLQSEKFYKIQYLITHCVWLCPLSTFVAGYLYDPSNNIWVLIDKIISKRIRKVHSFLELRSVTLLGTRLKDDGLASVDNIYANTSVNEGIIILIILVVGSFVMCRYAVRKKMYPLYISIIVYSIYGLTEGYCYKLPYNFTLLYFSLIIFNKKVLLKTDIKGIYRKLK